MRLLKTWISLDKTAVLQKIAYSMFYCKRPHNITTQQGYLIVFILINPSLDCCIHSGLFLKEHNWRTSCMAYYLINWWSHIFLSKLKLYISLAKSIPLKRESVKALKIGVTYWRLLISPFQSCRGLLFLIKRKRTSWENCSLYIIAGLHALKINQPHIRQKPTCLRKDWAKTCRKLMISVKQKLGWLKGNALKLVLKSGMAQGRMKQPHQDLQVFLLPALNAGKWWNHCVRK